jgi:hypothetical protein
MFFPVLQIKYVDFVFVASIFLSTLVHVSLICHFVMHKFYFYVCMKMYAIVLHHLLAVGSH